MGKYTTNPLRTGHEIEKSNGLDTLGGDAVTAELFGIRRLMSCDSVRRNLKAIPMEAGTEWIWNANLHLVEALLDQDYILDMDPTVKPLYGHQEGAAFGYNPQKPGRPSSRG